MPVYPREMRDENPLTSKAFYEAILELVTGPIRRTSNVSKTQTEITEDRNAA